MALNERPDRDGTTPAGGRGVRDQCPDAERLAEYADGLLDPAARAAIEAHLVTCADCRFAIVETMAFLGVEDAPAPAADAAEPATTAAASTAEVSTAPGTPARVVPFRIRSWVTGVGGALAAAAALVLIVRIASPEWLPSWLGGGPPLEALVAALETQPVRPVEGRLMGAGGFAYARPPSVTRGGADSLGRRWSSEVKIAAGNIHKYAEGNSSARARAALGVALIVDGDLDAAIVALEDAAKNLPDDAAVHANLSAAYLARAQWWNHAEDWQKAFVAAGRAIKLEPNALEPRFNHALAVEGLERNGLVPEGFGKIDAGPLASALRPSFDGAAARAWADYASRDRNSEWTREAEEHRKALSVP